MTSVLVPTTSHALPSGHSALPPAAQYTAKRHSGAQSPRVAQETSSCSFVAGSDACSRHNVLFAVNLYFDVADCLP